MHNNGKKTFGIFVLFCLTALAIGGYFFFWKKPDMAGNPFAGMTPSVNVEVVKKQNVEFTQELPGRVSAFRIAEVRPQIDGVIKKRKFTEGGFVKEGQQLYQIDPTIYQIALDNASANLKTVRAKRDRYKSLRTQDAVSKQEFDDVMAAFAQAEADHKKAQTNLGYTKVYAPISGHIGKSNLTEGALVMANQTQALTTITQLDPIYVDIAQSTKDMLRLGDQKQIPVSLVFENSVAYENVGTLKFSEVFADDSTDSVSLRAQFSNKDRKLIPGMFVNAKLHLKAVETITVPQKITTRTPDGNLMVWVLTEENIAKMHPIKTGQTFGDQWVVLEGLDSGDTIIVDGFQKLKDGDKVTPVFPAIP